MEIRYVLNSNKKVVKAIQARLNINKHCPCVPQDQWNADNLCICKEFREAPVGSTCHCGLYQKIEK